MPVALSMVFSNNGAEMAAMAASSALFFPLDTPTPSMAVPELHITDLTSAKSTFTNPGIVMISDIPCTPYHSISFHFKK